MCELRLHLKGLILLSLLIIISCQTTNQKNIKLQNIEALSVDYYTIKTPEAKDVKYLDKYIKSKSKYSNDALILKAGYYVKIKDYAKAFEIFKNNPQISTKNETLKRYFYDWRVKSYLENKEKPSESDLNKINLDEYCNNINYRELINDECSALANEKKGKDIYLEAASGSSHPMVRKVFSYLASQEDFHIREIQKWTTTDLGATWEKTPVTAGSRRDNVRPVAIRNAPEDGPQVLWMTLNSYRHYTDFDSEIKIDVAAPE